MSFKIVGILVINRIRLIRLRGLNDTKKIFRKKNQSYENNNEETTGTLLVSVSGIDFKDVYILLADEEAGHAKYL